MPSNTWGSFVTPYGYKQQAAAMDTEIPKGAYLKMVSEKKDVSMDLISFAQYTSGDMSSVKQAIETQLNGAKPEMIRTSYDSEEYTQIPLIGAGGLIIGYQTQVTVKGFQLQVVAKNENAGMTGLEIAAIIASVAFLAVVIVILGIIIYAVYTIVKSVEESPIGQLGVGIIILIVFVVVLLLVMGVGLGGKVNLGKGKSVSLQAQGRKPK
jgi:hypothetical protein